MGNRVSGRSRHKKSISADASTSTGKSPPSSGSISVRLRAAAVRVGYRRGGGRSSEQVVSCPNLGDDGTGDGDGQRQLGGLTADGGGEVPDLTVYRSYGGGFGDTTTPDDDDVAMHGRGRLAVVADSVPDIKIYRRSTVLYNDDDDNVLHYSNHRVPSRSRSAADGIGNGHVVYPGRRRERDRDRDRDRHHAQKSPTSPTPTPVVTNRRVTVSDFPDTDTVRCRLRQFEDYFLAALTRRHASLPTSSARLGIVSFAIHLQSRPRRTVSLLQYLTGGAGGSAPTIPRQLLDPHGDNDGEYIVTVPDGLFHAAMCARDAASTFANDDDEPRPTTQEKLQRKVLGTAEVDTVADVDDDVVGTWLRLADEMVKCAGREAARELARMFEYQISLLSEDRALRLLAEHAVECAAAYVDHQRGVWERNSLVRGAVFGAVFGHTETVATSERPVEAAAERRGSRRVSVIVGHRELKWDIGDVLKRPGLRRDCLLYGVGAPLAAPVVPTSSYRASTTRIDGVDAPPFTTPESARRHSSLEVQRSPTVSDSGCPWSFHVSAACDADLYGYRGALLDWDYFASAYAPVADDDGWFNELSRPSVDDFHRLYRPYRCLVGTELMQSYCGVASTSSAADRQASTLAEYVRTRLNVDQWARDVVEPVYRPLKALSLGRLRRADFAGTDLTRIGLTGVDLRCTGLRGCVLEHARLTAARLGPPEACDGVNLSYASLVDADIDSDLLRSPAVTAQFAVVGVRSLAPPSASAPPPQTTGESPDIAVDEEVCIDDAEFEDNRQLLLTAEDGSIVPVTDIVATLRRQGVADRAASAQIASVDACTSSQAPPRPHHELNGKPAPGYSRRRSRKKRGSGTAVDAAGDSTGTSEDAATNTSRPKLRRKKKTKAKKKTKKNGAECLRIENTATAVQTTVVVVNGGVGYDVEQLHVEEGSRQNGADHPSSSFVDVCVASPEVDRLSCEPDGSSSHQEAEVVDYSMCSTVDSGRDRSLSPVPQPSLLPPASTTASTSLYGQPSSFLSDVHGSLPLLCHCCPFDDKRRLVASGDRSSNEVRCLPKAVSLQGYQHLLSVDDPTSKRRHRHPRRLTAANYRPLIGQRGQHTLRRLDVEYINRSQIFEMISVLNVQPLDCLLPDVDPMLIGRSGEIDDVVDLVRSAGRVVTIVGCPGVGKSALAVAVAHALRPKSVVSLRIDAAGCRSAAALLRRVAAVLGLRFRSDNAADRKYLYNWINVHEQRTLLLFDDVDDLAEEEVGRLGDVIDELMANVRNVRILCTARRRLYRVGANREVYRLGDMSSASESLVRRLLPDLHDEGVDLLTAACDHVPLALRVACAALSSDRGDADAGRLFELLTAVDGRRSTASGAAVIDQLFTDDEFDRRRLRVLADCLMTTIDTCSASAVHLIAKTACFAGSGFDVGAAATALGEVDAGSLQSTLDRLADLGVVARLQTTPTRYRWRSFVSVIAASTLSGTESADCDAIYRREVTGRLKAAVDRYHESVNDCYSALQAVDVEYDNVIDVLWRTLDREDAYDDLATLARLDAGAFLSDVLPDDVFIALYEAVERESAEHGQNVGIRSRAFSCLSYRHVAAGRTADASSCAEQAVELSSAADVDGEATVSALYSLSRSQKTAGERRKALSTARQAFDACKTTGLIIPSVELTNIVAVYAVEWYASLLTQSDNFQTARHCYNLSDGFIRDKLQGHPLTIDGLSCRRAIWDRLSLFERATAAARGASDAAVHRYGDHPRSATALAHLGDAIVKRGCLNEAIESVTAALAMRVRVLGQRDAATASSYRTLAYLMLRSGQYDQAERFGRAALDACAAVADDDDDDRGSGVDDDVVCVMTEARDIVTQARYRQQSRSSVYVQLETHVDVDQRCAPRRARKL